MTEDDFETEPSILLDGKDLRESIIRSVDFKVEAILGEASLTLEDLEKLESGAVLPLSSSLNDVVSLRLNGVEIAKGELVSVGDKFAVKLSHVSD